MNVAPIHSRPQARSYRPALTLSAAAAALVLSACGGDTTTAQDSGTSTAQEGADGTVRLGYFPLVHTASAVQADAAGHFEDAGLDVELVATGGGAEAIPALVSGSLDVVYGNYTSALLAAQQGLPIRIFSGNDVGAGDHGIMVAADSELEGPGDLAGARVAVNNLQNIGTVAVSALVEEAGEDPADVQFVEMPYPNMQAALDSGEVDAIWQVEPFRTTSLQVGHSELLPLFSGPAADMPVAGWMTTQTFADENPEVLADLRSALEAAMGDLQDDRDLLVELVPTFTQVPAEVVQDVAMPRWSTEIDTERLTLMSDLMVEYGLIDEAFDISSAVVEP